MSPYLQLLLQKRPQLYPDYDPSKPDTPDEPQAPGPTVAIGPRVPAVQPVDPQADPVMPVSPPAQQPTMALQARAPVLGDEVIADGAGPANPAPTMPLKPRDRIEEDRQRLIDAQNKKPPSLGRRILETAGQYAASGLGINLRPILHPRGSETEQAQRQLATDIALQNQATQNQDAQSTIALRGQQAAKIKQDMEGPSDDEVAAAAKKQARENFIESMKLHPQPLDPNDPNDQELLRQAKAAGILLPNSYGKQPKAATERAPLIRERTNADGSKSTLQSVDNGKTWAEVPDLASAAPPRPDIPEPGDIPDSTAPWIEKEKQHREIANNAKVAADRAEQSVRDYAAAHPGIDPAKDPMTAPMLSNMKRLRETVDTENKNANDAQNKRIEAANTDARERAKAKGKTRRPQGRSAAPAPTTHGFSISGWLAKNPGKTGADAKAFHDADPRYRTYTVIP